MGSSTVTLAPGANGAHVTFCRLCEAQCGMIADVVDGRIVKVRPDHDHPVSEGHLCVKGPGMVSITYDPDRILTPLRRTGGPGDFEPVSWDEALSDIAARLMAIVDLHGGPSTAIYHGNPSFFNMLHTAYSTQFLNAIGGTKLFAPMHNDGVGKTSAGDLVYGPGVGFTFPDLERCDFLIILGGNPLVSHMSLVSEPRALHRLNAIHERDGVVVVDPRRTETARKFEHVPIRPDSDIWLLAAMLNHIFTRGLEAREVLAAGVSGWEGLRDAIRPVTPELASVRCDVPADQIRRLAERLVKARTAAVYGRIGTNRGRYPTLVNVLIEALNLATGRFGEAGGMIIGKFPLVDPDAPEEPVPPYGSQRSRLGDFPLLWGYSPGGAIADEITVPGPGQTRAMFIVAGNPVSSYPNGDALAAALEEIDLLVALDLYVTETTRHAHYILPTVTFFERADFTDFWVSNAPRPWVQFVNAVIDPVGEARHEYDIYNGILVHLGLEPLFAGIAPGGDTQPSIREVVDSLLRAGVYGDKFGERESGLSVGRLLEEFPNGYRPVDAPDPGYSWTRMTNPSGRPELFHPVVAAEITRMLEDASFEDRDVLKLFSRRRLGSMNSWMHNVEKLVRSDRPTLIMHPDDARERSIHDGQMVQVSSKAGSIAATVELSDDVIRGSVNYPHGWGNRGGWKFASSLSGSRFNDLASSRSEDWERVSAAVHLDGIDVTVIPAV